MLSSCHQHFLPSNICAGLMMMRQQVVTLFDKFSIYKPYFAGSVSNMDSLAYNVDSCVNWFRIPSSSYWWGLCRTVVNDLEIILFLLLVSIILELTAPRMLFSWGKRYGHQRITAQLTTLLEEDAGPEWVLECFIMSMLYCSVHACMLAFVCLHHFTSKPVQMSSFNDVCLFSSSIEYLCKLTKSLVFAAD